MLYLLEQNMNKIWEDKVELSVFCEICSLAVSS